MRKSQFALIAAIVAACGLMALINHAAYNSAPHPFDDAVKAAKQKAAALSKPTPAPLGDRQPLVTEATIGSPSDAKLRVTLGYTADNYIATHTDQTDATISAVENWAKSNKSASLQIVCVDIPADERADPSTANVPVGLTINGKMAPGCNRNIGPFGLQLPQIMTNLYGRTMQAALAPAVK